MMSREPSQEHSSNLMVCFNSQSTPPLLHIEGLIQLQSSGTIYNSFKKYWNLIENIAAILNLSFIQLIIFYYEILVIVKNANMWGPKKPHLCQLLKSDFEKCDGLIF